MERPLAIGFTPFETRADVILRIAEQAEAAGLDLLEVAEGWTLDSTILLTEIAARTSRIGIGTSVISVWGRTPGTIAMTASGLQRCSGGRFTLGLGASSPPLTEGFHGIEWGRPVERLRSTLVAVRALLAGERLPSAAPGARPLKLGALPQTPVPIGLAALSPASVRLAGELADAWSPFLWSRARLRDGRALLDEGERRSADPARTRVAVGVPVAFGPDEQSARRLAAWWLATYCTRMGPLYPRMLGERFGMSAGVDAVVEAAGGGHAPELPAAAEELAHEVTLMATYDQAREAIDAWFDQGADEVHLVLPPGRPHAELEQIVRVAAQARDAQLPRS
jgi:alkanesulfonate monooxygenase SsuD/methylene tetrahydromethanopterin reductase-like flavin-dependent oxidoreductase (luciferase family)